MPIIKRKHLGIEAFQEYAVLFADAKLPDWYYYVVTAAKLIPIIKTHAADPAAAPDARPRAPDCLCNVAWM